MPNQNESRKPESFEAAVAAMKRGQFSLALRFCEEALATEPLNLEAAILASSAATRLGDIDKAIGFAMRVIEMDPRGSTGYAILGRCYSASGKPEEAVEHFGKAISLEPNQPILLQLLGQALQQANRHLEAIEAYSRAIRLTPNLVEAHLALGQLYIKVGDRAAATQCFRIVHRLEPHSARGQIQLAKALIEDMEFEKAEEALLNANRLEPKSPVPLVLLGQVCQQCGRFEEAAEANLRAIELQPAAARPYLQYVQCRKVIETDRRLIERMTALVAENACCEDDRWQLHFALGKALDDLGEYGNAIVHFDDANRIMLSMAFPPFDPASHSKEIDATIRSLPQDYFAQFQQYGSDSDAPVFIVGMIRSGTTLVEQIVSNHPDVSAGGELKFWLENTRKTLSEDKTSVDAENLRSVAIEYQTLLDTMKGDSRRITDKMPLNYLFIGAMHLAFPNARFIHCRRNPLDNCLSMFITPFPQPVSFLHSRENIVFYYKEYLRLMEHWRMVIPTNRLIEVDYENLVLDPEPVTRQIIDFLHLSWDDACLHPHASSRAVRTPSAWQVRQPIYRSSMDRWKNYEPWLGAFRELLPVS